MKGTVFAVALNHRSQSDAWLETFQHAPYLTPPKTPIWFIKPRNTIIHSGDSIPYPPHEEVQSGATIALIISKTARKATTANANQFIAGYALANDVSLPETSFYRPAIKAKCRDGFCPLGELTLLKDMHDINALEIITIINGQEVDRWNTADLHRSAIELLCALSEFATLQPGDAILIGTPQQRVTLHPGDHVTLKAAGLSTLENSVGLHPKLAGETA